MYQIFQLKTKIMTEEEGASSSVKKSPSKSFEVQLKMYMHECALHIDRTLL